MRKFAPILVLLGVMAAVLLVGITIGWFGSFGGGSPAPPLRVGNAPAGDLPDDPIKFAKHTSPSVPAAPLTLENPASSMASSNLVTDWQERLDGILSSETDEADKAKKLLDLFPNLAEEGQVEVAQHLSNLVPDQDYAPLGGLLTNSTLPPAVLDVLMADALNRPNSLKLPLFLELARVPQHPKATEAKDLLELFLGENLDQDWSQWQVRLDQWLRDNPD